MFLKNIKMGIMKVFISAFMLSLFAVISCGSDGESGVNEPARESKWTIMYYGDADNNLESYILEDLAEMKSGFVNSQGVNLIALVDRIDRGSSDAEVFGENFTDTRLYRITNNSTLRIGGSTQFPEITGGSNYEANLGDALTLKKFVQFCKANYPADHYALILSNHGGGAMKKNVSSVPASYAGLPGVLNSRIRNNICYDDTDGEDFLYTAELSDILTSAESVDLFALDACLMSSVEFAYQFRNDAGNTGFKADIMVASAPNETGKGYDYKAIMDRLQLKAGDNGEADETLGGNELYYDPSTLSATELGAIIVEEQRDSTSADSSQSLTCLDLSKIKAVKDAVDLMSLKLDADANAKTNLEALRGIAGDNTSTLILHYFDETDYDTQADAYTDWIYYPYFDLYNLSAAIEASADFSTAIQADAASVKSAVDQLVLYSFANADFAGFLPAQSGVHIFFPDGDYTVKVSFTTPRVNCWYWQDWYNAIDISNEYDGAPLGKLAWCIDGAVSGNSAVENWFELLDKWFDTQSITYTSGTVYSNFNYYSY